MSEFLITGPGKYRTRGGRVVDVMQGGPNRLFPWRVRSNDDVWSVTINGGQFNTMESMRDIVAVADIQPGTWVNYKGGKVWFVGRTHDARCVVSANDHAVAVVTEEELEPWVDPPKPRTVTAFVGLDRDGKAFVRETMQCANYVSDRDTAFPVVKVTLTEQVQ